LLPLLEDGEDEGGDEGVVCAATAPAARTAATRNPAALFMGSSDLGIERGSMDRAGRRKYLAQHWYGRRPQLTDPRNLRGARAQDG
jgi:hypothetical protein